LLALALACAPAVTLAQTPSIPDPEAAQVPNPPPGRSSAPARPLSGAELIAELRRGGLTLYFRHTATDFSQNDKASRGFDDCANQRGLIERGRADARTIGAAIRDLKIPVERVLASPLCRTMETARLIFTRAQPSLDVRAQPGAQSVEQRFAPLAKLLATPGSKGTNVAIVSHGNPFYGIAGPPYLVEGEVAVIRGLGGDFEVIGRIRPEQWATFAR
jgi:hypothetical protein